MKVSYRRPVSLLDHHDGRRIRVEHLPAGAQLVPLGPALDVLGYWHRGEELTVYVAGPMPAALRTAAEQGRTREETWLGPVPAGLQEVDLTDCRYDYLVRLPGARVLPLYPTGLPLDEQAQQAA